MDVGDPASIDEDVLVDVMLRLGRQRRVAAFQRARAKHDGAQAADERDELEHGYVARASGHVRDREHGVRARIGGRDHAGEHTIVELGHRRVRVGLDQVEEVDRLEAEVRDGHLGALVRSCHRVAPRDRAGDAGERRQDLLEPAVDRWLGSRARRGIDRRRDKARLQVERQPVRQRRAGIRRSDDFGLRWEAAGRVGGQRPRNAVVVAAHGLVDALGESEVGHGVVHVEQRRDLGVDRSRLVRPRRRERQAEGVARVTRRANVLHQLEPVDDVARFHGLDRDIFGGLRRAQVICPQRELLAKREDIAVDLGQAVEIVQPALEPVAEQRTEALTAANSVE